MEYLLHKEEFRFGDRAFEIFVPDEMQVKQLYSEGRIAFPFWSRIWPSSIALCEFIQENPGLIAGKKILELAAGLGLPSFIAAGYAQAVVCSDLNPDAVRIMEKSIRQLGLNNVSAIQLDWNRLPEDVTAQIILLSDINYEPTAFPSLVKTIEKFIGKGCSILLSSPQRLMAKDFINKIKPFIQDHKERTVGSDRISIFIMG